MVTKWRLAPSGSDGIQQKDGAVHDEMKLVRSSSLIDLNHVISVF